MAAKRYTVDVNGTKETIQTYSAQAGGGAKGEVLRFRLPRGAKVELGDEGSNHAPQGIKVRRIGDDLHIALPGSDVAKPDIIVQEFYKTDGAKGSEPAQLIGRGTDGEYHAYNVSQINNNLPASPTLSTAAVSPWGKVTEAVAPVIATDTVPTAAPVAAAAAPGGVQMSTTAWVLTGVGGVAVVGALAAGGGGGGGGDGGDKPIQSVTAASTGGSVTEGENAVFTVTLRNAGNTPTTWSLALGGDSASSADFDASKLSFSSGVTYNAVAGTITVPAGVTSFTVTVPTVNDALIEANEAIKLDVQGTSGTVSLVDNDQQSVATVVATNGTAVIEGQPLVYTVILNAASQGAQSYALGLTGSGANTATIGTDTGALSFTNGVAYDAGTGKITVPAGVETFEVQIATASDGAREGAESLQLSVGGVNVSGTITDNDASSVTLSTAATISEGGSATYQVLLASTSAVSEVYALDVGGTLSAGRTGTLTFSNGVTYSAANGTITVPANVAAFTVTVPVAENNLHQATETLNLKVGSKTGGTVTVNDNDAAPVLTLSQVGGTSFTEGSAPAATYTVTLSAASALPTQVHYATTGGTAAAGQDFTAVDTTLTIAAGQTSGSFTVAVADDQLIEANETYSVALSAPVNATLGSPASVTTTIADDDVQTVSSVVTTTATTTEGAAGGLVYTVNLSLASPVATSYAMTLGGTATTGTDYPAAAALTYSNGVTYSAGNLNVPANVTSFTITVPSTEDTVPEAAETVIVTVGGKASTAGTITDDDVASATVTPPAAAVAEGDTMSFGVTLSAASPVASTQNLTLGGTAIAADHGAATFTQGVTLAPDGVTLNIPANVASFGINFLITNDTGAEAAETLSVQVGGGTAATGTIAASDNPATVASVVTADTAVAEGQAVSYTVTLSAPALGTEPLTITAPALTGTSADLSDVSSIVAAAGGTVTGNSATGYTLTPTAGVSSVTLSVTMLADLIADDNEQFVLNVGTSPSSSVLVTDGTNAPGGGGSSAPELAVTRSVSPTSEAVSIKLDSLQGLQDAVGFHAGPGGDLLDVSALLGKGSTVVDAAPGGDSFDAYTPAALAQGLALGGNTSFSVEADLHAAAPTAAQVAELLTGLQLDDGSRHVLVLGDTSTPGQAYVFEIAESSADGNTGVQAAEVAAVATLSFSEGTQFADLLASNLQTTHTLA